METFVTLVILILLFFTTKSRGSEPNDDVYEEVRFGLVAELSSREGKLFEKSFSLALSDFYRINNGYRTRVSVFARDSQRDPLLALAAATYLVKQAKVEAIVGAQSLLEAKLLAAVSEKAKVPLISALVPSSSSLNKYDRFLQLTHDSTSEAKGITRLVHGFNWESIVVIYEAVDDWREGLQILMERFQDEGIHIARTASLEESGEDYMVMNQLQKLIKSSRANVFLVHMSEILVSRLFRCAEKLGMMEEGYAWILTATTMNQFHYSGHRSMQGVIGFRSYIPESEELTDFTSRLRKSMVDDENVLMGAKHSSVWAHDIACILATAVEKIRRLRASSNVSSDLLETIRQSRFKGLSLGEIKLVGNKFLSGNGTFEIVNMVGTGERRIGLWSRDHFRGRRRNIKASYTSELETIIWPGGSSRIPGHRSLAENGGRKRLRVLVTSRNRFPHLVAVRPDPETGLNTVTGFCVDVFKTCLAPFGYELEFIPYDGDNYDNLAYALSTQRDKYDAAVGDISITSDRSLYVDFTSPYTDMTVGALELKKKRESMWTFFDPLDKSLWLASGAFFVLTGIVVWLLERAVNPEFQGTWMQQIGMMLWFGFSTLVFAHGDKLQKTSTRFLVIVWVFVVLILTSSYSANLASTKTVSRIQFSQLLISSPAIIGVYRTNILNNFEEYVQALRNGTIRYVVAEPPYLSVLLGHYPGVFDMIARESISNGFGFMFQRGSGLVPNVSREIVKLRSSGRLKDMEKRWFEKMDYFTVNPNTDSSENDDSSKRLTIHELGGLFIIAGVAHALVLSMHLFQMRREILRVLSESQLFTKLQNFSGFFYK